MKFESVDKILDFAIEKEEEAARFYSDLGSKCKFQAMRDVFKGFAMEEMQHKAKLVATKQGNLMLSSTQKILDLKVGDHLVEIQLNPELEYRQALIIAMKAEKAAFKLYHDLASATDDANLKTMFLGLAQEEAKHKLRFELEYDEEVLREN